MYVNYTQPFKPILVTTQSQSVVVNDPQSVDASNDDDLLEDVCDILMQLEDICDIIKSADNMTAKPIVTCQHGCESCPLGNTSTDDPIVLLNTPRCVSPGISLVDTITPLSVVPEIYSPAPDTSFNDKATAVVLDNSELVVGDVFA